MLSDLDDAITKLDHMKDFNPELLKKAAVVVQDFVEGYHEKLEEDFLSPRMRKAGQLVELVKTLDAQPSAGRLFTATIISLSTVKSLKTAADQSQLRRSLAEFVRMSRPHEAHENTVLFPQFKKIVSEKEYLELGLEFERRGIKKFGKNAFETVLTQITEVEKGMGLGDLNQFTFPVSPTS